MRSVTSRRAGIQPGYPASAMFDALSDKLQSALGDLRGRGVLDEEAISRAMREVRLALLEADVNFERRQGLRRARARARARRGRAQEPDAGPAGREDRPRRADRAARLDRLAPRVRAAAADDDPPRRPPGLGQDDDRRRSSRSCSAQGGPEAGARRRRPPAPGRDRAARPARRARSTCPSTPTSAAIRSRPCATGSRSATADGRDVVILDTAGRLHVDEALMDELAAVRDEAKPTNVLLVLDAMTGQEAVNVAQAFQERIDFDGVVLTKLDGDARGGAALSVRAVTGRPIKLASTRREARRARLVPPRPHGVADPRHGRRPHADRARRGGDRRRREGRPRAPHDARASSRSTTSSPATRCCAAWGRCRACSR